MRKISIDHGTCVWFEERERKMIMRHPFLQLGIIARICGLFARCCEHVIVPSA
jgi:hypothetical protein